MALYLNLYHEVQKQKLKRQRDPLKLAIMGLLLVAAGLVGYYLWRVERVKVVQGESGAVVAELQKYDPQATVAQKQVDAYNEEIKLANAIIHKMENRFYWAPVIEQIISVVPADVQVTDLDGSVSTDGLKKVTLSMSGIATGDQPRAVAEELRIALQKQLSTKYGEPSAIFRSLEDGAEPVQYQGKSSPTVLFIIDITFTSPDIDGEGKPAKPLRLPRS